MTNDKNISDYELVEKICKSDIDAFDQIFNKYGDRLFGFILSYLKSKEETECIVQNVFLKIWEKRKSIKKESSLKSYLFTIAYHEICQEFRKKQLYERFVEESAKSTDATLNLEEQLEYKATLEQVDKLISQLPEKQQIIFIKSRKEGKSTKEIAEEMNLAPGTIDNQISAALKFLRNHIAEENIGLLLCFAIFFQ